MYALLGNTPSSKDSASVPNVVQVSSLLIIVLVASLVLQVHSVLVMEHVAHVLMGLSLSRAMTAVLPAVVEEKL